ncbi:MAG: hypothetical protein DWQ05_09070 [Calditrichaeota bacterium]|nr:MAG: hypothetical protein DWQ05_09070 [Calditrichota bacterium]
MRTVRFVLFFLISITVLVASQLNLQAQQGKKERLQLKHANQAESYLKNNELIRKFYGNVIFSQGEMNLQCDELFSFEKKNEYLLRGHVKIQDPDFKLVADSARYFAEKKVFQAYGDVTLSSDDSKLNARTVTYFQTEKRAVAEKDVQIDDKKQRVEITGQRAELVRKKKYTKITGDPLFIQYDSTGREEMRIVGESMESFDQGKHFEIKKNVKITRDSTVATCGFASYFADSEIIELQENPVAINASDKITGEKMQLQMRDKKLQHILVTGKSKFVSTPDSSIREVAKENYLTGQSIQLYFVENEVRKVHVNGTATSVYHIVNEDGVYQGQNWAQGDTIIISIAKKAINRIKIKSEPGNSQGKFSPPEGQKADSSTVGKTL